MPFSQHSVQALVRSSLAARRVPNCALLLGSKGVLYLARLQGARSGEGPPPKKRIGLVGLRATRCYSCVFGAH